MAKRGGTRRRLISAVCAVALAASACSTAAADDVALPPPPEIREVRASVAGAPDDGLLRLVATIPSGDSSASSSGADGAITGVVEGADELGPLTFGQADGLPPGSTLTIRDDVLGYLDSDGRFVPLDAPASVVPTDGGALEFLREVPGVERVQPITDSTFAITATSRDALDELGITIAEDTFAALSTDPYEPYQWAIENDGSSLSNVGLAFPPSQSPDADVDGVSARPEATGRGIVVAVVDAGVDFGHPDLAHAQWVNPGEDCSGSSGNGIDDDNNGYIDDCGGWDFGDEDNIPFDGTNDDHGTHVAGLIAARGDNNFGIAGIAPDAEIMDLKVSHSSGSISISSIARAVRYAVDNGADIVNLSLGTNPGAPLSSVTVLGDAVDYAEANGTLLVAAAGNSSVSLDRSAVYPASFGTANLLTVAASTASDGRASFSNTGSDVDLFAPGDLILSTIPGNDVVFMSGTSQASPIAAATAALILEGNGSLSPPAVIATMVDTADPVSALNGLAANPVRLNTARSVGVEADIPGVGDAVTIRGLGADDDGRVTASITIGELGGQFNQPFGWEASLVSLVDGAPFAVVGHPVTTTDADESVTTSTDGRGSVTLASDDSSAAEWSTTLPPGRYALMIEAVPLTDSTARLGDGFLARFDVGDVSDESSNGGGESDSSPGSDAGAGESDGGTEVDSGPADSGGAPDPTPDSNGDTGTEADSGSSGNGSGSTGGSTSPDGQGDSGDAGTGGDGTGSSGGDTPSNNNSQDPGATGDTGSGDTTGGDGTGASAGNGTNSGSSSGNGDTSTGTEIGEDTTVDTIELGPEATEDDGWTVTNIAPRTGQVDSRSLVIIDGSFPEPVNVWFGESPGDLIFGSETTIMVETPLRSTPGTVDIILRTRDGEVLRVPGAYTFIAASDGGAPPSDTGSGGVDSTTGGGGSNTNTGVGGDPGTGNTDANAGTGTGTAPGGSDSEDEAGQEPAVDQGPDDQVESNPSPDPDSEIEQEDGRSRNRQSRAEVTGDPRELPNGLTGAPVSGLETIGGVPACNEALCRTRRV